MKKYELIPLDKNNAFYGTGLNYRIKALKSFNDVKEGDLGGYVDSEDNLSHLGNCWIYDESVVCHKSVVKDDSIVRNNGLVSHNVTLIDKAIVDGTAIIGGSVISGDTIITNG